MAADDKLDDAKRVLRWLSHSLNSLNTLNVVHTWKLSDIHARILGSRYSVEEVEAVVDILVKRGYLRQAEEERRTGRGRKPSPRFHVHPSVFMISTSASDSECSDNSENSRSSESGADGSGQFSELSEHSESDADVKSVNPTDAPPTVPGASNPPTASSSPDPDEAGFEEDI
jgi:hypothetical protein